jgi:hypothetical protein
VLREPLERRVAQRHVSWRYMSCCAVIVIAVEWRVGGYMASEIQMPKSTPSPLTLILGSIAVTGNVLQWRLHRLGG